MNERERWIYYKLKEKEKIILCKKCLTLSTRPRVGYDENGVCNACQWAERKNNEIDWKAKWKELEKLCDRFRITDGSNWDVLVPCSGGKDSASIAWRLKYELNMHPLLITVRVPYPTEIGKKALDNLIETGFDHILVTPNPVTYKKFMKHSFITEGRPKMPFEIGISLFTMNLAAKMKIPFIMYGEEGEQEYGGTTTQIGKLKITRKYLIDYYYNGHDPIEYEKHFNKGDLKWWRLPSEEELEETQLFPTHWSHFMNWDPKGHYDYIKDKYDFPISDKPEVGTFMNYSQLDDKIQDLHAYMMYIKFGFGRCWSDVCIEIRAGRMTREKGIELVKKYDGEFPYKYLDDYLKFYDITEEEFWNTIDSFRSSDVWEKIDGKWKLKFEIE